MAKKTKRTLRERLSELSALGKQPATPVRDAALLAAVEDRDAHVVARAVRLVRDCEVDVPIATIDGQFTYFTEKGTKRDPGCVAKLALVELIDARELPMLDLLMTGASLVQSEPVWGSTQDTAAGVRIVCTLALVQLRSSHAPRAIVERLTEADGVARRGGVEALCAWGDPLWTPALLRFRLAVGEPELDVRIDSYVGLLEFDREATLETLRAALAHGSAEEAEAAALALGTARVEESLDWLVEAVRLPRRRGLIATLIAAVALLRVPRAVEALIDFVRTQQPKSARVALEALEPYLDDESVAKRIQAAAEENPDPGVLAALESVRRRG